MPNSVVHFEIPADDVARAKAFYEKTFGWTITAFPMPAGAPPYFGVKPQRKKGEPGIDGGLLKRNNPGQPFTTYIAVTSLDAMNQAVQANGGTIVLPKQEIGKNMGWISVFKDTENNILGLHESPAAPPRKASAGKASPKAKAKAAPARKASRRAAKKKRR